MLQYLFSQYCFATIVLLFDGFNIRLEYCIGKNQKNMGCESKQQDERKVGQSLDNLTFWMCL